MNESLIDRIAAAVLYEGYLLYPYRPSVKTRQRWTFGGLLPRNWCDAERSGDRWAMECECLVRGTEGTTVSAAARFLHLIERTSLETVRPTDAWQEGMERRVELPPFRLGLLIARPHRHEFAFAATRRESPQLDGDNDVAGIVVRKQEAIEGAIEISTEPVTEVPGTWKLRITVNNLASVPAGARATRDEAMLRSLVSTHAILAAEGGEFVSLTDPPEDLAQAAKACRNVGAWPVLVGEPAARDAMLCSPIILPDYPQIAPESPGDLFDGTEIDEILSLRILTLTDDEKRAAAAVDDRARRLLERTESLAREQLLGLHGTFREPPRCADEPGDPAIPERSPLFPSPGTPGEGQGGGSSERRPSANPLPDPPPEYRGREEDFSFGWGKQSRLASRSGLTSIRTDSGEIRVADHVRLHPLGRADPFDMLLAAKAATVVAIEQDYEDQVLLAVTIDDDPGKDLGHEGKIAHRFFFRPDEVERLAPEPNGTAHGNATSPT